MAEGKVVNWFKKHKLEEDYDEEYYERYVEIQRIKRRIAELRHTLFGAQRTVIPRNETVEKPQQTVDPAREAKNKELNDLKAKLMGKKK